MKQTFEGEFHNFGPQDGGWYVGGYARNPLHDVSGYDGKRVRITIEAVAPVILCIFGSREVKNHIYAYRAIEEGVRKLGINLKDVTYVLDGGAKGMDNHGHYWAKKQHLDTDRRKADWDDIEAPGAVVRQGKFGPYNAVAGHWRNQQMTEEASHFIGVKKKGAKNSGTEDMIGRVEALGKPLFWTTVEG